MKNLKRILAIATSMTMAIAMVAGVTPMTVKATDNQNAQQEMEFYGFQRLTSADQLSTGQIIYFTQSDIDVNAVYSSMPDHTGVLEVIQPLTNVTSYCSHAQAERGASVRKIAGGDDTGFDGCSGGVIWFDIDGNVFYTCTGTGANTYRDSETWYAYSCSSRPVGSGGDGYTPDPAPYIPPHEHTYEWVELVDMDGYFLGQEQYKCTGCGHVRESRTLNYTCPVIDETLDEVAKVESEIAANPTGANRTITKDVGGYYFINRPLAEAFTQNGTITLIYTFLYEHKLYKLTIPAGFDLTAVLNEEGYAGFMWIAAHPGTTLEEIGEYYY